MKLALFGSLFILLSCLGVGWLHWLIVRPRTTWTSTNATITVTAVTVTDNP